MRASLKPAVTLGEIFGAEKLYSPRASPGACAWLPGEHGIRDLFTGGQFAVLGDMPVLCAAGVSGPEALGLLSDAGYDVPRDLHRYRDGDDYLPRLSELSRQGRKIVVQHVHPVKELAPASCWVLPSALSFVNNKGNLAEFVEPAHLPNRKIVAADRVLTECRQSGIPLVMKAVTDESTGAGTDVRICRSAEEIEHAAAFFGACSRVVIEEFLDIRRNLCLNYAVSSTGSVRCLGSAEQVSDAAGAYHGNWIDAAAEAPEIAVKAGFKAARAAFDRGYWGICGVDTAVTEEGRVVVFDLNCRVNGSTSSLLLADSVRKTFNRSVIRLRSWKGRGSYREMLKSVRAAMGRGWLLPLNSYDPAACGLQCGWPRITGLIIADSRGEVREREAEMTAMGFEP